MECKLVININGAKTYTKVVNNNNESVHVNFINKFNMNWEDLDNETTFEYFYKYM